MGADKKIGDDPPSRTSPTAIVLPHLRRAQALGIEPRIVRRPGLALDIDTPDDLAAFLAAPSPTRTYAYLEGSGIARRIARLMPAQSAPP